MLLCLLLLTICVAEVAGEILCLVWMTRGDRLLHSKVLPGTPEGTNLRFELAMVTKEGFAKTINAGGPARIC